MPRLAAVLVVMTIILPSHSIPMKKCFAKGKEDGPAAGLSVSQPTRTCALCSPTRYWEGKSLETYKMWFAQAMSLKVEPHTGKCVCYTGKDPTNPAAEVVKFYAIGKEAGEECKGDKTDPAAVTWTKEAHRTCWKTYGRILGQLAKPKKNNTWTSSGAAVVIQSHSAPWSEKDFEMSCDRSSNAGCEGDDCYTVALPSAVTGMDEKEKEALRQLLKKGFAGKDLSKDEQALVDGLTDGQICALLDRSGDGDLSAEELAEFYEGEDLEDIKKWIKKVDDNRSEEKKKKVWQANCVECDEFKDFKEAMRQGKNEKADESLDGMSDLFSPQPIVQVEKAKWQATAVDCFKGTKQVDPKYCQSGWADGASEDEKAELKESACASINEDCT